MLAAFFKVVDERYEEAIASAKRAVALGPGDVEAHVALGYVYLVASWPICRSRCCNRHTTALKLDPNLSCARRPGSGGARLLLQRRQ